MGHSNWSDAAYTARQRHRTVTNTSAFSYDADLRKSGRAEIHPQMNPFKVTRESRDSDAHPDSLAIGVIFDVTGSMGMVPRVLQTKLGALMRVLIQRGFVAHPQVLFGAVGDAYCDKVPLQIGQFESGLEMDDDLGKLYIEGGGGGQVHESYELAMYFMARHTPIDCWDKHGRKGYLFTLGDELPYDVIRKEQIQTIIGDHLERDLTIAEVVAELGQRYQHFHIIPTNTSHGSDPKIQQRWQQLLGERVLLLEDETAVCETIALAIGLCEGTIADLHSGTSTLVAGGYDPDAAASAATALTRYAASATPVVRLPAGVMAAGAAGDDGRL
jgi:hypothetical protein